MLDRRIDCSSDNCDSIYRIWRSLLRWTGNPTTFTEMSRVSGCPSRADVGDDLTAPTADRF